MIDSKVIAIPPDALEKPEVVFWDVDFVPVVDLMDDRYGVVALDEPVRLFPCEEAYLKGIELTREQFARRFPEITARLTRQTAPA